MFSKRKKRRSIRRNLTIVALLFLLLAGLAAGVRVFKLEPVTILPEDRDALDAKRKSPENGYFLLAEAVDMADAIKPPLGFINVDDPKHPGRQQLFECEPGTMGEFLGMQRPDDSPELLEFLRAAEPATQKAREALSKPFVIPSEEVTIYNYYRFRRTAGTIFKLMIAQANAAWKYEDDPGKAVDLVVDMIHLADFACAGIPDLEGSAWDLMPVAYKLCRDMAAELPDANLTPLQTRLRDIGRPFQNREEFLKSAWRVYDETQLTLPPERNQRFPENLFTRFFMLNLRKEAKAIRDTKDQWLALLKLDPIELGKHAAEYRNKGPRRRFSWAFGQPYSAVERIVLASAVAQQDYYGTLLVLAIEQYRRATGALPENLEDLVPAYIAELPMNPLTETPFKYKHLPEENGYFLLGASMPRYANLDGTIPATALSFEPQKYRKPILGPSGRANGGAAGSGGEAR